MRKLLGEKKPADLVMALAETKADAIVSRLKTTAQFEVEAHSTLLITADTTTCWVLGWHIHLVLHNIYILCLL
ncbi:hypothetical protein I3760_01G037200 [Carya illinoinensis]|nr:hypothetical protein I3760_01G037200 [Carya illinoinensis]KAG2724843.1 hypothetical protein I3760_01G037200 [Carya illinoinensis]KAG2724844.1 hypothetical protein I3760_01G037200 [Carya illinoinensis]KAG2724845.1 hypothetical protein I3760_01G037200 [Carya illinoinensis]KAG2724846.1 hypothetical protein I3760_01G037200 [Carya illinoinensis]